MDHPNDQAPVRADIECLMLRCLAVNPRLAAYWFPPNETEPPTQR